MLNATSGGIESPRFKPDFTVHGAESVAPAAATVLADTGALAAVSGTQLSLFIAISADDAVPTYEVARRNAANAADVELAYIAAASIVNGMGSFGVFFSLANNERVVVRNKTAGTAAKTYQVDLYGFMD